MEDEKDIEQRIISAAREVFIRRGYDAATMSDIALLAGMSRTSVNYYFRTKERLFEAIFEDVMSKMLPQIEEITQSDLPYLEKLGLLADQYQNLILSYPTMPVFVVREMQRDCSHLLSVTSKLLNNSEIPKTLFTQMTKEMEEGKIRKMNPVDVLSIFMGSFIFPMLTQEVFSTLFFNGEKEKFMEYISHRKELTMRIMTDLLKP